MPADAIIRRIVDADIELIRSTLDDMLSQSSPRTSSEIFDIVGDKLSSKMPRNIFCPSLSANISIGRIPGFYSRRGPGGGIFKGDKQIKSEPIKFEGKKQTKEILVRSDPNENKQVVENYSDPGILATLIPKNIEPKPEPKPYLSPRKIPESSVAKEPLKNTLYDKEEKFTLFIDDERFDIPCNPIFVKNLLELALFAKEDPAGNIKFLDKIYNCPDPKLLERILMWFLNAAIVHKSKER